MVLLWLKELAYNEFQLYRNLLVTSLPANMCNVVTIVCKCLPVSQLIYIVLDNCPPIFRHYGDVKMDSGA